MKIFVAIPLLLSVAACDTLSSIGSTSPSGAPAATAAELKAANSYVVQPGDALIIYVWKEKDLQSEVRVRPDGGINFPLVGDVDAAGKSLEQLQKDITAKLTKYVPDPIVTVSIKESAGNMIYIVGKVLHAGNIVAVRNMDVMQALSMAGGPSPYASVNKIKILRRVNGQLVTFPFKYSRVEKGEDLEQNIILQGGDVIVVP
jgi:polysaccharide export outer membrane protein